MEAASACVLYIVLLCIYYSGVKGELKLARRSAVVAAETRGTILDAARTQFTEIGFQDTTLASVARAAGVTEGAIFHHFGSKKGLFRSVFEHLEKELDEQARASSREGTPLERFVAGCRAYLEFVTRADYARIVLLEGPGVLGHGDWHNVDAGLGLRTVDAAVRNLIRHKVITEQDSKPLAVLLYGALNESAFSLARREEGVTVEKMIAVLERLLPKL